MGNPCGCTNGDADAARQQTTRRLETQQAGAENDRGGGALGRSHDLGAVVDGAEGDDVVVGPLPGSQLGGIHAG